ncbi:hypothetical protein [Mangrovibacterium diazotrophicum]|uniref:Lipid-binding hydrolase n=1 Tax=Mangrovibacterium diazotrophicum TaxID=1261403 RepID=A0A419W3F1_9BACT|nr:hypothetical protein [Mangrovibacterium diazotrophicum]RKD90002.1 hypothetical protein BC643_0338 [Mangrovibacterium diazotrophicum]
MKKITLLILSLFLVAVACNEADDFVNDSSTQAQEKSAYTKTYQWKTGEGYFIPLMCDGETVDVLNGSLMAHYRWHVMNGQTQMVLVRFSGELTSEATGETFVINESDKIRYEEGAMMHYSFSWNVRGNWGSHYIGSGYLDLNTWEVVPEKTVCPPSNN